MPDQYSLNCQGHERQNLRTCHSHEKPKESGQLNAMSCPWNPGEKKKQRNKYKKETQTHKHRTNRWMTEVRGLGLKENEAGEEN